MSPGWLAPKGQVSRLVSEEKQGSGSASSEGGLVQGGPSGALQPALGLVSLVCILKCAARPLKPSKCPGWGSGKGRAASRMPLYTHPLN